MIGEPKIDERAAQPYVGIRVQVPHQELPNVIPQLIGETAGWLGGKGIEPAGAPIIRYHVINMDTKLDIEIGFPVANAVAGDERVNAGVIPAGRYASLVYTGVQNGLAGNRALIEWAKEQGLEWDRWDAETGDAFRSRIEFLFDGPDDDPDPSNWDNEVAIKLADS